MADKQPKQESNELRKQRGIGESIGGVVDRAVGVAVGSVESVGLLVGSHLRLPGLRRRAANGHSNPIKPGSRPGIEAAANIDTPPEAGAIRIRCIDFNEDRVETFEVDDIAAFLETPKPDWCTVRWINVDGLHPWVINQFRLKFGYHTLAAEDALHVPQRPKVELYDEQLFVVGRMVRLAGKQLLSEQVSFFLSHGQLVTFQERQGDVWEPIRERIHIPGSRIRKHHIGYLTYALLDAMVDHGFPILESYGDELEEIELQVTDNPDQKVLHRIHGMKRELISLRRVMWPMREVVDTLHRDEHPLISASTRTYLRDVYDHAVQLIDIVETFREMAGGLTDLYMSSISNRMNEVMKVLTIMASLFIPITFIAGVYGMNFEYIPELKHHYAYPIFWVICISVVSALLYYFKRKGWL